MKKILALVLALLMATACFAEQLDGGWTVCTLNEGETSDEAVYVDGQVAVLAAQVVAGTNYCLLVRTDKAYQLVYVYEALDGQTEILKTQDLITEPDAPTTGGWGLTDTEITPELFEKATAQLMGATYTLVKTLGMQTVAGFNYLCLCRVTPVAPDATAHLSLVTIFADLEGGATVTNVTDIELGV